MIWIKLLKQGAGGGACSAPEQKIVPCQQGAHDDALVRVSHAQLLEFNHATESLLLLPPQVVLLVEEAAEEQEEEEAGP